MQWTTLLRSIRSSTRRQRTQRSRPASPHLQLETLEDRRLMSYSVFDLGAFAPRAINDAGQVAGISNNHAVLWENGALTDLGAGNSSTALGINDAGQVVGRYQVGTQSHAFLWDRTSGIHDLGTLPSDTYSEAHAINGAGQTAGESRLNSSWYPHAVVWDSTGAMTDLGTFGHYASTATALNSAGQVVGWAANGSGDVNWDQYIGAMDAFYWDPATGAIMLGNLPGHRGSQANDINDSGQVVGSSGDFQWFPHSQAYRPQQAILWANGQMTSLGTLPGDLRSDAKAINNTGQVVGLSYASSSLGFSQAGKAFVWQDGVMNLIAGSTDFIDINDGGMIVRHESSGDAYLLIPDSIPALTVNDVSLIEGNTGTSSANFTVTLSAASSETVTVNYGTTDGTAAAGSDYQAASGTLTFAPGETSKTISVPVNGDRLAEPIENFLVNLSSPMNAMITRAQAVATILDDEPRISISDMTLAEGKKGQTTRFTFTISLSAAYDQPVTMSFRTTDGTASIADKDYLSQTSTLIFNPGETQKTITIIVNGDSKKEANETFYLDLFGNSSNSLFTKSRGIGTILNDD